MLTGLISTSRKLIHSVSVCCESVSGLKICKPSARAARRRRWSEATSTNLSSVLRSSVAVSKAERKTIASTLLRE